MNTKVVQSLTAYSCRICKKYCSENLLELSENNKKPLSLEELLMSYFKYINVCKIDKYTSRALMLASGINRREVGGVGVRLHVQPKAGKALENFDVINHTTNEVQGYKGENHSAVYTHNIMFYLNGEKNVFLFHHYGQSGCKTAFLNTFNEYLSGKGLVAHLDVLMSKSMFSDSKKYEVEKLSLITTYDDLSSDKADNIRKKKRKRIEQETIITIGSPRAERLKNWIERLNVKEPSIDELKTILAKDDFQTDFEEAKITVKIGKVTRKISLSEFTGLIAEYDITDKLDFLIDGSVNLEKLFELSDEYVVQFLK